MRLVAFIVFVIGVGIMFFVQIARWPHGGLGIDFGQLNGKRKII